MDSANDGKAPPIDQVLTDIAHYVHHYKIKKPDVMKRARLALLDALGCAMETLSSDECPSFIGPIVKSSTTWQDYRLPGTAFELDPVKGAFDMAVLIRYLDHNDAFTGAEWSPSIWLKLVSTSATYALILRTRQRRCYLYCGRLAESQQVGSIRQFATFDGSHSPHCAYQGL